MLSWYCRQAFTNLDQVTTELVLRVALLANKTHKLKKGKHTKKTAQFVKACLAYCHITIPSLDDIFARYVPSLIPRLLLSTTVWLSGRC